LTELAANISYQQKMFELLEACALVFGPYVSSHPAEGCGAHPIVFCLLSILIGLPIIQLTMRCCNKQCFVQSKMCLTLISFLLFTWAESNTSSFGMTET